MADTQSGAAQAGWNPMKSFENLQAEIDRLNLQVRELQQIRDRAVETRDNYAAKLEQSNRLIGEMEKDYEIARRGLSYILHGAKDATDMYQAACDAMAKMRPSGGFADRPNGLCGVTPDGPGDYCHNPMPCPIHPRESQKRICECTGQGHAPGCEIGKRNHESYVMHQMACPFLTGGLCSCQHIAVIENPICGHHWISTATRPLNEIREVCSKCDVFRDGKPWVASPRE